MTGRERDTWEAAGEPGEVHATLGTGDNENESGENKSISTPSTGPLTLHQHPTYTRGVARLHLQTPLQVYAEHVKGELPATYDSVIISPVFTF